MKWKALATSVVLGLSLLIFGLSSSPTLAQPSPVVALVEKSDTTPTEFWWLHGASESQVKDKIDDGYRIIDLEVEQTSPYRFSVAMVKNQGVYAKNWWWYYGLTSEEVKQKITQNETRIIDLQVNRVNGQKRYAVVMVANTGTQAKSWWYYTDLSLDDIMAKAQANQARVIDLDIDVVDGQTLFSAVMIKNTGADQTAWWVYSNVSPDFINSKLKENNALLIEIERRSADTFTVVMEKSQGQPWWWYYGLTEDQVNNLWQQNGARIIGIEPYTLNGNKRFAVIMINNSNALTTRIGEMMRDNTDGVVGLYLKQVNASVLASLQSETPFYPASTIKVLQHLHSMRAVEAGNVNLDTTLVKVYPNPTDSCSNNHAGQSFNNETLRQALEKMMNDSNNQSTNAIQELFGNGNASVGRNAINQTAHNVVGMSNNTAINHKFGCGGPDNNPANSLTLFDLGKLYEKVATGLFTSDSTRDTFYNLMLNGRGEILTIIDEESAKLGVSTSTVQSFKNQVKTAAKAGSFTTGNGTQYRSIGGWVTLPFEKNGSVKVQEYVFGLFIDKATNINDNLGILSVRAELLRDEIRAALTTFK